MAITKTNGLVMPTHQRRPGWTRETSPGITYPTNSFHHPTPYITADHSIGKRDYVAGKTAADNLDTHLTHS